MKYPRIPRRKSNLAKGFDEIQLRKYADECIEQALMFYGTNDYEKITQLLDEHINIETASEWEKYVIDILQTQCNQSPEMARMLARKFAKKVPSISWGDITNDEVIELIPKREIDLSALILLGKRVNNLLKKRNSWD